MLGDPQQKVTDPEVPWFGHKLKKYIFFFFSKNGYDSKTKLNFENSELLSCRETIPHSLGPILRAPGPKPNLDTKTLIISELIELEGCNFFVTYYNHSLSLHKFEQFTSR